MKNKLPLYALISYFIALFVLIGYKKPQIKVKPAKINIGKVIQLENQVKL